MAEIGHFARLARLMLHSRHRGNPASGRMKMEKIETFAFTVGLLMTGLFTFVAVPLA